MKHWFIIFQILLVALGNANAQRLQNNKESFQPKLAILPVVFLDQETGSSSAEMAKLAQTELFNLLSKKFSKKNKYNIEILDLRTTNFMLKNNNIDYTNVDEIPLKQLREILGADFIVSCKVKYVVRSQSFSNTSGGTIISEREKKPLTRNPDDKPNDSKVEKQTRIEDFSSTVVSHDKLFDYTVYLDIYHEDQTIFSQIRRPLFQNQNSWLDAISYLVKRSPLYK